MIDHMGPDHPFGGGTVVDRFVDTLFSAYDDSPEARLSWSKATWDGRDHYYQTGSLEPFIAQLTAWKAAQ